MAAPVCRVCLGTMTFSGDAGNGQVKKEAVREILKAFCGAERSKVAEFDGKVLIDTARVYQASTPDADTETVLGEIFREEPEIKASCSVATKAIANMTSSGTFSKAAIVEQCDASLKRLGVDCIDLYYLHAPDIKTDIEDTLDGIDELSKAGKIKEFGISNYPAWKVVDIYHRCKARGMVLPTVYQGMYNGIARDFEREVVPVLREFGMRALMYNPLAGGLLTGRYAATEDLANATEGRFSMEFDKAFGNAVSAATVYRDRFGKAQFFEGLVKIKAACEAEGVAMPAAALRWALHHSYLSAKHGDGIIFGVSRPAQVLSNLEATAAGPLPKAIVDAIEEANAIAKPAAECYFRGYGPTPGDVTAHLALHGQSPAKRAKA